MGTICAVEQNLMNDDERTMNQSSGNQPLDRVTTNDSNKSNAQTETEMKCDIKI